MMPSTILFVDKKFGQDDFTRLNSCWFAKPNRTGKIVPFNCVKFLIELKTTQS